jgi:hypothetical protein
MFAHRFAGAIAIAVLSSSAAMASTGASLQLSGNGVDLNLAVDTSNATFTFGSFDISLAPGQTIDDTFSYTVTVTDDGGPATRNWSFCTPITQTDCGPAATGFEQAYASIWMGRGDAGDPTPDDYMISDSDQFVSFQSVTGQPGVYTGTIDYTATNLSSWEYQSATVAVLGAAFVDASAVPEPPVAWLLAAGLMLASFRPMRRFLRRPD